MENNNNKKLELDMDIINNDPIMIRAKELTDKDIEISEKIVQELLGILVNKLQNENIPSKYIFMALGKTLIYMSQSLCSGEEEFVENLNAANKLVVNNVFPSLGAYANDKELNESGEIMFKGEFDEDNFSFRRLMMVSGSLVDYCYWKANYNTAISEQIEKEEKEKED